MWREFKQTVGVVNLSSQPRTSIARIQMKRSGRRSPGQWAAPITLTTEVGVLANTNTGHFYQNPF